MVGLRSCRSSLYSLSKWVIKFAQLQFACRRQFQLFTPSWNSYVFWRSSTPKLTRCRPEYGGPTASANSCKSSTKSNTRDKGSCKLYVYFLMLVLKSDSWCCLTKLYFWKRVQNRALRVASTHCVMQLRKHLVYLSWIASRTCFFKAASMSRHLQ